MGICTDWSKYCSMHVLMFSELNGATSVMYTVEQGIWDLKQSSPPKCGDGKENGKVIKWSTKRC